MKKYLSRFISIVLIVSMMCSTVAYGDTEGIEIIEIDLMDQWMNEFSEELRSLLLDLEDYDSLEFILDENEDLQFITGFSSKELLSSDFLIEDFMNKNGTLFGYDFGDFDVFETNLDEFEKSHYKVMNNVDGIPVYGSEIIVHTDEYGKVYAVNGEYGETVEDIKWNSKFLLGEDGAIKSAETVLGFDVNDETYTTSPFVEQYIYNFNNNNYATYLVTLEFLEPYPAHLKVFVNAENGKIIDSYDGLMDNHSVQTGVGLDGDEKSINVYDDGNAFYLRDTSKNMSGEIKTYDINHGGEYSLPGTLVSDSDGRFDSSVQNAAVDAHFYAGYTYDYFKNIHNRNSYDGNGASIISTVHFDSNYNNAFWSGSQMVYGDGDGNTFSPLCGSLDVVAHELTHAVTQNSANLEYRYQSGALNESYSDVFGAATEYRYKNNADWYRLAEDIYTPNKSGDEMRNMKDPTIGDQPGHMDDYVNTTQDNGGVHINSGIPNRAFYLLVEEIGMVKAEKIYYRTLVTYLTTTSDFNANRAALLQACSDLYGYMGTEYVAVANSQAAVGIGAPINNELALKAATVSVNEASNTGAYTITITVPATNTATNVKLYEGTDEVWNQSLSAGETTDQVYTKSFTGKAVGSYTYKAVVSDTSSSLDSDTLSVTVSDNTQTEQWHTESISYDTAHYYSNNYDNTISYTKEGASKIGLHMSYFRLEDGYDFVYVLDGNDNVIHTLTGDQDDTWVVVDGDVIKLRMVTDAYVTDWGYRLDAGKYYSTQELFTIEFE